MVHVRDLAVPPGADADALSRRIAAAHDEFIDSGVPHPRLRPVVADSWKRSLEAGLDPESVKADICLNSDRLDWLRATHPLADAMPIIRSLLVDDATECGLLVAVSEASGLLLWVEGDPWMRSQAERMHFMAGADWSETSVGTNAPGTALALDQPVQIYQAEHLARRVTRWSCSAVPIHHPRTGETLGVLDVTGGNDVARPQALALVRATVAAVEAHLGNQTLPGPGWPPKTAARRLDTDSVSLKVLGRHGADLVEQVKTTRLSERHSEILLLLAESEDGYSAPELAVSLFDEDHADVTVRAEMSRLRAVLGPGALTSRPYRLTSPMCTDVAQVRADLRSGDLASAVARYDGPVLPASTAPAIVSLRSALHSQLRSAVLTSSDADAVLACVDTAHSRDDYDLWMHALRVVADHSPRRRDVIDRLAQLDAELR